MTGAPRVSVVVAAIDAAASVAASLERFADEVRGRGEVLLVDASSDHTARVAERLPLRGVNVLRRPIGRLVPQLWRDGIEATGGALVALSTAQMVARHGWLDAMLAGLEESGAAGVGGPIEPAEGLSAFDKAVYLLRYVNYLRPWPRGGLADPPGDNALYRRDAIEDVSAHWREGFWETRVHDALRARGSSLAMVGDAVIWFRGGARPRGTTAQRHRHARHYGAERSLRMGVFERLSRTAAAPAVPLVLLQRIKTALAERGEPLGRWAPALPWLGVLLAAWSSGEAVGTWAGPPAKTVWARRRSA